jgi:hypothetical protein
MAEDKGLPALTLVDQGFVLLVASTHFWTPDRPDRVFLRGLCQEQLPRVNRAHPYLEPIARMVEAQGQPDTAGAQLGAINTQLGQAIHAFLRWRGLEALACAQELGQIEGPKT